MLGLAGRGLLAGGALAWVVVQSGPTEATAVIHVTEPNVVVSVDDRDFSVEGYGEDPIVVDLPAGEHVLEMRRGAETLYREDFEISGGDSLVLTAWASREERRIERPAGAIVAFEGRMGEWPDPLDGERWRTRGPTPASGGFRASEWPGLPTPLWAEHPSTE